MTEWLVIGFGNELRRDDGAGPRVARTVADWHLPGVRALAVHQLTPELAAELARAKRVVFVDAAVDAEKVCWRRVCATCGLAQLGHASDVGGLLFLTEALSGRMQSAWIVTLPAPETGYGSALSAEAIRGVATVLSQIAGLRRAARSGREVPADA
jgi:hydrogenase maturation protease